MTTPFSVIAAVARNGAIGVDNHLPWRPLRQDLVWFRLLTTALCPQKMARHLVKFPQTVAVAASSFSRGLRGTDQNAVIMGRRTWASLLRPLAARQNYVLSSSPIGSRGLRADTLCQTLALALDNNSRQTFVIGGAEVYAEALRHPDCQQLYLTEVEAEYPKADTWWPWLHWMSWDEGQMRTSGSATFAPWYRTHVSDWITEPRRPRYRLGIWAPLEKDSRT